MSTKAAVRETPGPPLVWGPKKDLVLLAIALHIFWTALAIYRDPFAALKVYKELIGKRRLFQGDFPVLRYVRAGGRYFWSVDAPGWPSASFRSFLENEMNRIRPFRPDPGHLSTMVFAVSSRCPLRCEHCFEWENLDGKELLSLEQLKAILEKFQRRGLDQIQLSGGEPLCRLDDVVALLASARPGTDFWLLTSGWALTLEKALRLKEAGLTGVNVSLDHWDEGRHNAFRGNGRSFRWAREAAANSRKVGLALCLDLCATRDFVTAEDLWRYLYLARDWGAGFIRILEPRKVGRYADKDVELAPEHLDVLRAFFVQASSARACRELPIVMYPGYYQRIIGCVGAGHRYLYVDSRGALHPCPFCQEEAGSALVDSLDEAIEGMKGRGCHVFETNARV
ncbi:MAG: radical SAM protein [candidate division Zixibacteria bacterium]|nr:radical SAM protein [candidate division Zixibacteria bacterium]